MARSEAFKVLMIKFRDHKILTKESFSRVKLKHNNYDQTLKEHSKRIDELEKVLTAVKEVPHIKIKKKRQEY